MEVEQTVASATLVYIEVMEHIQSLRRWQREHQKDRQVDRNDEEVEYGLTSSRYHPEDGFDTSGNGVPIKLSKISRIYCCLTFHY